MQISSKKFSNGDISNLAISLNPNIGTAEFKIQFRNEPKNKSFSIGFGKDFVLEKNGDQVVCSGGMGAKFENFPPRNISEDSTLKPGKISYQNKLLVVDFNDEKLKGESHRENNFKNFPNCFGISYWVNKSSYSKGTNCGGFVNQGFVNLNCTPYEGWSRYKAIGSSIKILLPGIDPTSIK